MLPFMKGEKAQRIYREVFQNLSVELHDFGQTGLVEGQKERQRERQEDEQKQGQKEKSVLCRLLASIIVGRWRRKKV